MSTMEVGTLSSVDRTVPIGSLVEVLVAEAFLAAGKTLACLLIANGSLLIDTSKSPKLSTIDERFPLDELRRKEERCEENKDGSDTEDDDDDEDEVDQDDEDDDGDDEDFSGEGEDEGDPDDDPEANGEGDSDDGDDDDDEDDEDGEEEEEEEEEDEEEEEEGAQPPSKKRK
ncbi:glutamic acid-rich protein-like [Neltuma alba]|uniref:glutamic acid-rich protein-like n=1 Tax=Neltuma alba TaxID=207710 RepID=UPI0010A47CEE|nr:glutamic acid-rich protein-like [Prosopis alba]